MEQPINVEQVYSASIETVWKSITEPERMRQWFFKNIPSFVPETGFETHFTVRSEGRNFIHLWKVIEVVPFKRLVYNWKYRDYPGNSFVIFELSEQGYSTKLRFTHNVTEDFPEDIPEFTRESCIAGWEYFIKQRLKAYLKNNS